MLSFYVSLLSVSRKIPRQSFKLGQDHFLLNALLTNRCTSIFDDIQVALKSVNSIVKCTQNTLEITLLLTKFTQIVRNEIFHVQCTNSQRCDTVLKIDLQV
jgi:hypothetical protein